MTIGGAIVVLALFARFAPERAKFVLNPPDDLWERDERAAAWDAGEHAAARDAADGVYVVERAYLDQPWNAPDARAWMPEFEARLAARGATVEWRATDGSMNCLGPWPDAPARSDDEVFRTGYVRHSTQTFELEVLRPEGLTLDQLQRAARVAVGLNPQAPSI